MTSPHHHLTVPAPLALALALATGACSGSEAEHAPLAAQSERIETIEKKTVDAQSFTVVSEGSQVTFEMQAPFEKQDGAVPPSATTGALNVDLKDLTRSTGLINVDISALEIYQQKAAQEGEYGERVKSDLQNEHMRDWLEIGDDAPEAERRKNALIQFELQEIKDASATDITTLAGASRKVTFTGVGSFRLHQRSSKHEVKLAATFTYDGDAPTGLAVETVEPFSVDLQAHDVRPRKGFGVLAEKTLGNLAPKVGKAATVSVAFSAKPSSETPGETVAAAAADPDPETTAGG